MKAHHLLKAALMLTASALLVSALFLAGMLSFIAASILIDGMPSASAGRISAALTLTDGAYTFTGADLLETDGLWAMLIGLDGDVRWQYDLPADVPLHYSLTDVASFTRWYLRDYSVVSRVREDGLLVIGSPKGSVWKHSVVLDMRTLLRLPWWAGGTLLLSLACVLGLSALMLRHWFRQAQAARDTARAEWINGISHDIRTPLSLVMGCAGQLEADETLTDAQRRRAEIIRRQSQTLRDLVNDLNLTMRLQCAMQPLRRQAVQPAAFLRQTVADFLNGGLAEGYPVELSLPQSPLPEIPADEGLLRRAVGNLLANCVRHNAPGCLILVGGRTEGAWCVLFVESRPLPGDVHPGPGDASQPEWTAGARRAEGPVIPEQPPDGGAAHGTGLKLVSQIASAHGGSARFVAGAHFRCELRLPVTRR